MEKRISKLLFAIIALICLPFLSSCSDNDTPEGEKLQNKLSGGVWKVEHTTGTIDPATYVVYFNLSDKHMTQEHWPDNLYAADVFESVSDSKGLRYYQYMHSEEYPMSSVWYVAGNTIAMRFTGKNEYLGKSLICRIAVQGGAKNSVDGSISNKGKTFDETTTRPEIPFPSGKITMTRSSLEEMNEFIKETKKNGTNGYAV